MACLGNLERIGTERRGKKRFSFAVRALAQGLQDAEQNEYCPDLERWFSPGEIRELIVEYAEVTSLANMVEAQLIQVPISDYLTMSARLVDFLRVYLAVKAQLKEEQA